MKKVTSTDADVVFWLMIGMLIVLLGSAAVANAAPLDHHESGMAFPTWVYALIFTGICAAIAIGVYDRFIAPGGPQ